MVSSEFQEVSKKLDKIIELLERNLVLELRKQGITMGAIAKNIKSSKTKVVEMLKGTIDDNE